MPGSRVISKLEIDIIFKQANLSEEWLNKLKKADVADTLACLAENNALLDMADENIQMHEAIDNLSEKMPFLSLASRNRNGVLPTTFHRAELALRRSALDVVE